MEIIAAQSIKFDRVSVNDFGTFAIEKVIERIDICPESGKKIMIPPDYILHLSHEIVIKTINQKMNNTNSKKELAEMVAIKRSHSKHHSEQFLRELFLLIKESLLADKSVNIKNFGEFKPFWVDAHKTVNGFNGDIVETPGHYIISISPYKALNEILNSPFAQIESALLNRYERLFNNKNFNRKTIKSNIQGIGYSPEVEKPDQPEITYPDLPEISPVEPASPDVNPEIEPPSTPEINEPGSNIKTLKSKDYTINASTTDKKSEFNYNPAQQVIVQKAIDQEPVLYDPKMLIKQRKYALKTERLLALGIMVLSAVIIYFKNPFADKSIENAISNNVLFAVQPDDFGNNNVIQFNSVFGNNPYWNYLRDLNSSKNLLINEISKEIESLSPINRDQKNNSLEYGL